MKAVSTLTIPRVPSNLLQLFAPFVKKFRPSEDDKMADLMVLFEFTKALGDCWEWLSYATDKASIIIKDASTCHEGYGTALAIAFATEHELYSSSFFAAFDDIMRLPGVQR